MISMYLSHLILCPIRFGILHTLSDPLRVRIYMFWSRENFLLVTDPDLQTAQSTMSRQPSFCKIWGGFKREPREPQVGSPSTSSSQRE